MFLYFMERIKSNRMIDRFTGTLKWDYVTKCLFEKCPNFTTVMIFPRVRNVIRKLHTAPSLLEIKKNQIPKSINRKEP